MTAIAYEPVRHLVFLKGDDQLYITGNAVVRGGLSWRALVWALTTGTSPYWHPLTWLSHLVDVQLFGLQPAGHHLVSLAIHIITTVLVFCLFRYMTGAMWRSAFVAALFGVHPIHVESVAWVAERKDVLSALCSVLTLWAYALYVRRPHIRRYLIVVACFALSLMAKPMAVTLPFVLLLLDIWPLQRVSVSTAVAPVSRSDWARIVREKIPLLLMAVTTSVATFVIQGRIGALPGLDVFPWSVRVENALLSYVRYLGHLIWPTRLAAFYPWDWSMSVVQVGLAAAVLAGVTGLVIHLRARRPYLLVGWLWFVGMLVPVIGLTQSGEQAMADRFVYVPMLGVLVMAAWGTADLLASRRFGRVVLGAASTAVVIACVTLTRVQVGYWSSDVTLWQRTIAVTDRNYRAYDLLGLARSDRSQWDEAMACFAKALAFAPVRQPAFAAFVENNRGFVLVQQGRISEALEHYAEAARLRPAFAENERDIGAALLMQARVTEAIPHYLEAVQLNPALADAQRGLADALVKQRRTDEAIQYYVMSLRLDPDSPDTHNNLGAALAMQGKAAQAQAEYHEALRLRPGFAQAENGLGAVLEMQGAADDALAHYEEAVRIDPQSADAHANLARALDRAGKSSEALIELRRAVDLDGSRAPWHYALAHLLARSGDTNGAIAHLETAVKLDPAFTAARRALSSLMRPTGKSPDGTRN